MQKGSDWNLDLHQNSYSFFDFDNTLYQGRTRYLILDFSIYLEENKKFNSEDFLKLKGLFDAYFDGQIDRNHFAIKVVQTYYHGLRGFHSQEIADFAINYWNSFQNDGWFAYTGPLLDLIKNHTIPILISGSPFEVIKHSDKFKKFNYVFASKGTIQSGVYTGHMNIEVATEAAKTRVMADLSKQLKFDPRFSFAFGDSSSDFPMLEAVDPQNAYLLVANERVIDQALDKKWNYLRQDLSIIDHVQNRINSLNK